MVAAMVCIGGLTRLTQSGLSMVTWDPVTGVIPPLSREDWEAAFAAYQQYPEYQKVNAHFTLADFQSIYWFEYLHRLLGRLTGLVYGLPLLWFLARRAIPRAMVPQLVGLLALGGLQGFVGWWMVASGLKDRPDVAQERLATHLGLAFLLFAALTWQARTLLVPADPTPPPARLRRVVTGLAVAVYLTALTGALVAGTDAGYSYNTFPWMNGAWVPQGYAAMSPLWRNWLDNPAAIQFNHRWIAITLVSAILATWAWSRRLDLGPDARRAMNTLAGAAVLQVSLGVATLLSVVWLPLASGHQLGALLLLAMATRATHALWRPGG